MNFLVLYARGYFFVFLIVGAILSAGPGKVQTDVGIGGWIRVLKELFDHLSKITLEKVLIKIRPLHPGFKSNYSLFIMGVRQVL